jgi:hypothetical protein
VAAPWTGPLGVKLQAQLDYLVGASLAASTARAYNSGLTAYNTFCDTYSVPRHTPPEDHVLVAFLVFLSLPRPNKPSGLAASTIKSYHSAVRAAFLLSTPVSKLFEATFRGIKKSQSAAVKQKLPITSAILAAIYPHVKNTQSQEMRVFWAVLTTGVFGLFRCGELLPPPSESFKALHDSSLTRLSATHYRLTLKVSKTDFFRQGVDVNIFATENLLCPINAINNMRLGRAPSTSPRTRYLFELDTGLPLSKQRFITLLRSAIGRVERDHGLGLNSTAFAGHSMRRGGATSLALRGVAPNIIQTLGRWRSDAYKAYIVYPLSQLRDAVRSMSNYDPDDLGVSKGKSPACPTDVIYGILTPFLPCLFCA